MTKRIATTAMMLALGTVLSVFTPFQAPFGGSVTLASMLPVIVVAIFYPTMWGVVTALVFSLLQMVTGGIATPPVKNAAYYIAVLMLDYVIAFGVLGLAGVFYRSLGKKIWAIPVSAGIVVFLRFICHFLSGILIWGSYAPEGQPVWLYSFLYNGSYMALEFVITVMAAGLMARFLHDSVNRYGIR